MWLKIDQLQSPLTVNHVYVSCLASKPYRMTWIHLLIISCETISSDAILPISLKIALADRQNSFFACGKANIVDVWRGKVCRWRTGYTARRASTNLCRPSTSNHFLLMLTSLSLASTAVTTERSPSRALQSYVQVQVIIVFIFINS